MSVYNRGHTEDGQLWIAMQFVDGTDAGDALRVGAMTPQRAVHIITEVGKALDFAHAHQVVHRDINENPEVPVQIRAERLQLVARDATDSDRDRCWPALTVIYLRHRGYRDVADRVIPLVVREPRYAP